MRYFVCVLKEAHRKETQDAEELGFFPLYRKQKNVLFDFIDFSGVRVC